MPFSFATAPTHVSARRFRILDLLGALALLLPEVLAHVVRVLAVGVVALLDLVDLVLQSLRVKVEGRTVRLAHVERRKVRIEGLRLKVSGG